MTARDARLGSDILKTKAFFLARSAKPHADERTLRLDLLFIEGFRIGLALGHIFLFGRSRTSVNRNS
jgi:hypothetical protein